MSRWLAVGAAAALVPAASAVIACAPNGEELLRFEQDLPADVLAEMTTIEARFDDAFGARRGCVPPAAIRLVSEVEGGDARYVAAGRRIEIAIPTTPARFRESLVHELAHHVEATCDEFAELRGELQELFGGGPWREGPTWEETPSELWAETVVMVVTGERLLHADDMPLPSGAADAVTRWANGA